MSSPCGAVDLGLLAILKRSRAYRTIRPRASSHLPSDSWREDGIVFIVFDLKPRTEAEGSAQALFALAATGQLLAARLIESRGGASVACDLPAETTTQ